MSPEQEGIVLRVKQRTQDFWSQQKQARIACQTYLVRIRGAPGIVSQIPVSLSEPWFLVQTMAYLTQRLGQESRPCK